MKIGHRQTKETAQKGNAMIYVLIALALIGFLTLTLARQNDQADGQDISDEQAEIYAQELMSYVASAQNAIDMMLATGSEISDLDFVVPSDAAFNTPPHIHKVFHPQGGGLNYGTSLSSEMFNNTGVGNWRFKTNRNVEWTPTTASDIILSNQFLKESVCANYNKKITGSVDIPVLSNTLNAFFDQVSANDFMIVDCPACEGYPTLCVRSNAGNSRGIYFIIAAQ